ncbi:hypothetical protein [Actinoplanes couchii]|nr:hypothetical protein [Actinoplanes couchii]MDR6323535.1 hypothetical protein [Actinoplanes couchii]
MSAHPLHTAVSAQDWPGCRAVLDAAGPMERTALIRAVAGLPDIEGFLTAVLRADPADGTASALLGEHLLHRVRAIRAEDRPWYELDDRATLTRELLCRAEQTLIDGAVQNPADPAIWSARLVSAHGLDLGPAETRRRYQRLLAAAPDHLPGQFDMLRSLYPGRDGSWEPAHEFARETAAAAPPGGAHGALVAAAHIDHGLVDPDRGLSHTEVLTAYLVQEPVRAEIQRAAERSGVPTGYGRLGFLNLFALCFTLLGDQPAAARMFDHMGDRAAEDPEALDDLGAGNPWARLGDAVHEFGEARERALGGAK